MMDITIILNGKKVQDQIEPDMALLDFVREHGCYSVKRGCDLPTAAVYGINGGSSGTSCSVLAARADGHRVDTLEGLQEEAEEFVGFIADQGADQCGFCNPGFVMNTIALLRENPGSDG